jgi:hypothetical protein
MARNELDSSGNQLPIYIRGMTMFCPSCGTPNDDTNQFCTACGNNLRGINVTANTVGENYEQRPTTAKEAKRIEPVKESLRVRFPHAVGCEIDVHNRTAKIDRMELELKDRQWYIPGGWRAKIGLLRGINHRVTLIDNETLPRIEPREICPIGPFDAPNIPRDIIQSEDEWHLELYVVDPHNSEACIFKSPEVSFEVDLSKVKLSRDNAPAHQRRTARHFGVDINCEVSGIRFVLIPPCTAPDGRENLSPYYLSDRLISVSQWYHIMGRNMPQAELLTANQPKVDISLEGIVYDFLGPLNQPDGQLLEIPTLEQWKFACTLGGGNLSPFGVCDLTGPFSECCRDETGSRYVICGGNSTNPREVSNESMLLGTKVGFRLVFKIDDRIL